MGKTALAAEAVREVVGTSDASLATSPYPDGVVFLDLYEVHGNLDRAMHALATTLMGEDFMEKAQPHDRAAAACRGKRILIIIEGGEEADGNGDHGRIADLFSALSPENRRLLLTRLNTQSAVAESVSLKHALDETDAAALLDSLTQGNVTAEVRTRVLALLEGHPLAITWAGNLLARGDESPDRLATDWATEKLPTLSDPEKATRTLEWLFNRSVRGLDDISRQALAAAGLLARAPFPLAVIVAALDNPASEQSCRIALRTLVQRGLLQLAQMSQLASEPDHWQFTHVLGYRFARDETGSDASMRVRLASALDARLKEMLTVANARSTANQVPRQLEHIAALLRSDFDQSLWYPLANEVLYDAFDRLTDLGRLGLADAALSAVHGWCSQIPRAMSDRPGWRRETSSLFNKQGDVRLAQGDLAGALAAFQASMDLRKALAESDPSNAGWQRDLSVSHEKVGNVRHAQGDLAGALAAFQASMDVAKALAESDPSNAGWQRDLSFSFTRLAEVCERQGERALAMEHAEKSLLIDERLAALDPTNATWQRDVKVSRAMLTRLKAAGG